VQYANIGESLYYRFARSGGIAAIRADTPVIVAGATCPVKNEVGMTPPRVSTERVTCSGKHSFAVANIEERG
jgi:hypothetical protein